MTPGEKRTAADFPPEAVRWLWRERIPLEFVTVIAGRPGAGKSLLTAHFAAEVTKQGGAVILSAAENPQRQVTTPRLIAAGADLNLVDVTRFMLPRDLVPLRQAILDFKARLVIIDPLAGHLVGVSRWSDSIRRVTTPLARIAEDTGCAIILIEHLLKNVSAKSHPLRAIMGSGSGVAAASQMVFVAGTDPADDDRVILASVKSNLRADPLAVEFSLDSTELRVVGDIGVLRFVGETAFDPRELLTGGEDSQSPSKLAVARDYLVDFLLVQPDHTARAQNIREGAAHDGISKKTLDRAAATLGIIKIPPDGGRNTTWTLPQEVVDGLKDEDDDEEGGGE